MTSSFNKTTLLINHPYSAITINEPNNNAPAHVNNQLINPVPFVDSAATRVINNATNTIKKYYSEYPRELRCQLLVALENVKEEVDDCNRFCNRNRCGLIAAFSVCAFTSLGIVFSVATDRNPGPAIFLTGLAFWCSCCCCIITSRGS